MNILTHNVETWRRGTSRTGSLSALLAEAGPGLRRVRRRYPVLEIPQGARSYHERKQIAK